MANWSSISLAASVSISSRTGPCGGSSRARTRSASSRGKDGVAVFAMRVEVPADATKFAQRSW